MRTSCRLWPFCRLLQTQKRVTATFRASVGALHVLGLSIVAHRKPSGTMLNRNCSSDAILKALRGNLDSEANLCKHVQDVIVMIELMGGSEVVNERQFSS